jgi:hypothetical protein
LSQRRSKSFVPKFRKIEGKLPVMLYGQSKEFVAAPGVEDQVVAADQIAKGRPGAEPHPESGFQLGGFAGGRAAPEKIGSEVGIAFEGGEGFFEEVVE